ncbi:MAG: hypothetical protein ABSA64_04085 [Sedimentisphaerales bacterium]
MWIVERWEKEWPKVKKAPFAFIISLVIGLLVGAIGVFLLYNYFVLPGKDSNINSLQSTIGSLQQQKDLLQNQKDDLQREKERLNTQIIDTQNALIIANKQIGDLNNILASIPKKEFATPDALIPSVLRNMDIRISDLAREDMTIHSKTFEKCHIYGPAIIATKGMLVMDTTTFASAVRDPNDFFVETTNDMVIGVIVFEDCIFRNCTLHNISFIGNHESIAKMKNELFSNMRQ